MVVLVLKILKGGTSFCLCASPLLIAYQTFGSGLQLVFIVFSWMALGTIHTFKQFDLVGFKGDSHLQLLDMIFIILCSTINGIWALEMYFELKLDLTNYLILFFILSEIVISISINYVFANIEMLKTGKNGKQ